MSRKPSSMYRYITQQAFTRREYSGGVPASRLLQFGMGASKTDFPVIMELHADETCQIRSQALEAARIAAGRYLEKRVGRSNFYLKVRVFPHQILRENKQATGAGADRVSQGMRLSYGGNVAVAARVARGQAVLELRTTQAYVWPCKDALRKAMMKLPCPCIVEYVKGRELALQAPKQAPPRRLTAEEKAEEEAAEAEEEAAEKAAEEAAEGEEGEASDEEPEDSDEKDE